MNPTEEADGWAFSGLVSGYAIPDDKDYLSPVFTADRGGLHLEGRYNYEDFDTASVWAGWNLSCGEKLIFDFTPMVGWVFGQTSGIAPGWRLGLSRGAVEFTSEAEFVFDTHDSYLLAARSDQADFRYSDAFVDTGLSADGASYVVLFEEPQAPPALSSKRQKPCSKQGPKPTRTVTVCL